MAIKLALASLEAPPSVASHTLPYRHNISMYAFLSNCILCGVDMEKTTEDPPKDPMGPLSTSEALLGP